MTEQDATIHMAAPVMARVVVQTMRGTMISGE
jgi:hypothetical protein